MHDDCKIELSQILPNWKHNYLFYFQFCSDEFVLKIIQSRMWEGTMIFILEFP